MSEGHEGESTRLHCGHTQVLSRDLLVEDLTGADGVVRTKSRHVEALARYIEEYDEREGENKTVEHSHGAPPASRSRLPSSSSERHLHSRSVCIQVGEVVFLRSGDHIPDTGWSVTALEHRQDRGNARVSSKRNMDRQTRD